MRTIYPKEFTGILKSTIKKRDWSRCQLCATQSVEERLGRREREVCRKLIVHHIDSNVNNCHLLNLITLCQSCHAQISTCKPEKQQHYMSVLTNQLKERFFSDYNDYSPCK